jgi:ubiquinone/menaquinone biosynthesis C-methylase UbiE
VRKVESVLEVILDAVSVGGKTVIDVGCGTGDVAHALAEQGARVIGIDQPEMLSKVEDDEGTARVELLEGGAEELPVDDTCADLVLFLASLHHVPATQIRRAVDEAFRVLKPGGRVLFIEPIVECSYYLITRLAEEETEARRLAHEAIADAGRTGFHEKKEDFFYLERSLDDFRKLLELFPPEDEQEMLSISARAEEIARTLSEGSGCTLADYRFQSACRLNLLRKPHVR